MSTRHCYGVGVDCNCVYLCNCVFLMFSICVYVDGTLVWRGGLVWTGVGLLFPKHIIPLCQDQPEHDIKNTNTEIHIIKNTISLNHKNMWKFSLFKPRHTYEQKHNLKTQTQWCTYNLEEIRFSSDNWYQIKEMFWTDFLSDFWFLRGVVYLPKSTAVKVILFPLSLISLIITICGE